MTKRRPEKQGRVMSLLFSLLFLLSGCAARTLPQWARPVQKTTDLRDAAFVRDEAYMQLKGRMLPQDAPDAPDALCVKDGAVSLTVGGETVYASPAEWTVQDAFFDDMDHDGAGELIVICWKKGSFGPHRPSWVKEDTEELTQRIFLLDYEEGQLRELWMSSALDITVASARTDGRGGLFLTSKEGGETEWRWLSWGPERVF